MIPNLPAVIAPPEPLTPANCDLRSYDWFPLLHKRLRRSTWWLRASDAAKAVSIELWCEAYEQVPAGSLPSDDLALSDAAGYGRRHLKPWLDIKEEVLSAWVLCADGRWYHPTLCEVALGAWIDRLAFRKRSAMGNAKRHGAEFDAKPFDDEIAAVREKILTIQRNHSPTRSESRSNKDASRSVSPCDRTGHDKTGQDIKKEESCTGGEVGGSGEGVARAKRSPPPKRDAKPKAPKPKKEGVDTQRGSRLPIGWYATQADRQYARDLGFSDEDIDAIEEDFRLWWPAQPGAKGRKTDWSLTWKTWVRKEEKKRVGSGERTGARRGGVRSTDSLGELHAGFMAHSQRRSG